jgi:hypothetical protein
MASISSLSVEWVLYFPKTAHSLVGCWTRSIGWPFEESSQGNYFIGCLLNVRIDPSLPGHGERIRSGFVNKRDVVLRAMGVLLK